MGWKATCFVENCKGMLPFLDGLRSLKRRLITYRPSESRSKYSISEGLIQIKWISEVSGDLSGKTVIEIGTGWEPLIPLLFSLCGASRVYLTDLTSLVDTSTARGAVESVRLNRDHIVATLGLESSAFDEWIGPPPASLDLFLNSYNLRYLAPCDCRKLNLADSSIDVITSRSVFEHIAPETLEEILRECYRLLTPGGLVCHFVDNSDHWEHGDKSISRVNFLNYEDNVFRWTHVNSLHYQNRLRHIEYVNMLERVGFQMVRAERIVDSVSLKAVTTMSLASRFRNFSAEDLATTDSYLLARKP